jgi:hypothetical protein
MPLFYSLTWSRMRCSSNLRIDAMTRCPSGAFAPHEDIAIVDVSNKPQPASLEFAIQFVKHDGGLRAVIKSCDFWSRID